MWNWVILHRRGAHSRIYYGNPLYNNFCRNSTLLTIFRVNYTHIHNLYPARSFCSNLRARANSRIKRYTYTIKMCVCVINMYRLKCNEYYYIDMFYSKAKYIQRETREVQGSLLLFECRSTNNVYFLLFFAGLLYTLYYNSFKHMIIIVGVYQNCYSTC